MHLESCPHCGKQQPAFDGKTVTCRRCGNVTQLLKASDFLTKAGALWPRVEVTLRSGRVARVIKEHDEYLKKSGWSELITATLDENWQGEGADDGHIDDVDADDAKLGRDRRRHRPIMQERTAALDIDIDDAQA